ncbi:glycosyltransferase family 15 protein [Crucibulum laeve]|uniref:Glycosyltransferase family 15 protein n=1 Tax=Crucibulum laeve TaxID=68775 RepID=A0A5C3LYI6_9AGAR|nr:glycosyltransferase family 15 protein [Crucibulum laeve]
MTTECRVTVTNIVRNSDLQGITTTIIQIEDRFNKNFLYPYVFLNDIPFDDHFKRQIQSLTKSKVLFGLVPDDHWNQPAWINESRAAEARYIMRKDGVPYGGEFQIYSYRNMCRFYSGFFFRHELLKPFKFYWRPDVKYSCDVSYDPFLKLRDSNQIYGFTISLYEYESTISSLWLAVQEFMQLYPRFIVNKNSIRFISNDLGNTYNRCHFWSNFEIGDLDFWRGEAYTTFFDFLDQKGGFYYERWGDAPIHSIALALFARKEQIHFFDDIGYQHAPFQHCPQGDTHTNGNCWCDITNNFDHDSYSCLSKFNRMFV